MRKAVLVFAAHVEEILGVFQSWGVLVEESDERTRDPVLCE